MRIVGSKESNFPGSEVEDRGLTILGKAIEYSRLLVAAMMFVMQRE